MRLQIGHWSLQAALDTLRWDERHVLLSQHPVFASCRRAEIRAVARSGDVISVEPGAVLLREDRIGYWFIAVLRGELRLSRGETTVGRVVAGDHVGEVAILGFGPQPATVTAATGAVLFVVGRRNVLDLVHRSSGLQRGLFPGAAVGEVPGHVRQLREQGAAAWREVRVPAPAPGHRPDRRSGEQAEPFRFAARVDRVDNHGLFGRPPPGDAGPIAQAGTKARSRLWRIATVTAALAAVTVTAVGYHPPVVIVRPMPAVDVVDDVAVDGIRTWRPTGRYVLTAVDIRQPNLVGLASALVAGELTMTSSAHDQGVDGRSERELARRVFADSRDVSLHVAAKHAHADVGEVRVRFRQRPLTGPSAALAYVLALADIFGPADLARGRTIAATGSVDHDGRVGPVGFLGVKHEAAARAGADLFIVPATQRAEITRGAGDMRVLGVSTVEEALTALSISTRDASRDS